MLFSSQRECCDEVLQDGKFFRMENDALCGFSVTYKAAFLSYQPHKREERETVV